MKKISLFFVIFFIAIVGVNAQPWLNNLPQNKTESELTFFDYQNAFNQYWTPYNVDNKGYYVENGVKKKASGWKQFKRWEWNMEGQVNTKTGEFPEKTAQQVYDEFVKANPQQKNSKSASWTVMGPNNSDGGYSGIGRINCIAFHPSDNNTYWIGAPAGGLWKTTDNGSSWTCLTDNNAVLGVSSIIIPSDYATSNTIYIGTGDRDAWDNLSVGVLKSTDGGTTWNTTGLSYNLSDNTMVNRMLLDPNDDNTIIAATSNGVYKTTDGGTNWSTKLTNTDFIDMEYKPGVFSTLYGSTKTGYIYVSTNSGSTWTSSSDFGSRIELAVTPANANIVYAIVAASNNGLESIEKSTNSGTSFTEVFSGTTTNLMGWEADGSDSGGQGWYDLAIAVSPTDADIVVVGGVNSWRSINGGTEWSCITHWWGQSEVQAVHADKHNLTYRSNGDLFECNDGGIYISSNNGTNYTDKTNGMIISQMYKLGVSQTVATEVITGLQDNGSKLISSGTWTDVKGGDGMECLIDYTDVNTQYATYVRGQITRTTDHWGFDLTNIEPSGAGVGAWVTPYIIHPTDHNTLYAGYANVWKTTNQGDDWTEISTMSSTAKLRSMAISSDGSTLYVADNEHIWKTTDDGATWTDITGTIPIATSYIGSIAVKDGDPNTLWVSTSSYNTPGVYESTNGGTSWTNISAGMPTIPCWTVVQNKQATNEIHLYAGTELGIYFKKGNDNWIEFNTGLPNVKIGEIEIYYDATPINSKLRAATYGRGLWETPLELENSDLASVTTTTPLDITNSSATVGGNVTNIGASSVDDRGIVWGITANPTINDNKVQIGSGIGSFSTSLTGLSAGTIYYVRAYAINTSGTAYGTNIAFTPTYCDVLNYPSSNVQNIIGTYTDLGTDGTEITTDNYDNANSNPVDIGFDFDYNCGTFSQFILNTNGFIKLGNTPPSTAELFFDGANNANNGIFNSTNSADVNFLSAFNHDLEAGTNTEYRVYTSGSAPNRVCTIQYKGVKDKTTSPEVQYTDMQFQIKLYETTNIIEFVYGDWTASSNSSAFKTSACGLKGASNSDEDLLVANKGSSNAWADINFTNANYQTTATLNFGNPPERPKPEDGRTFIFTPIKDNDLKITEIYSLGKASIVYGNPQTISANIINIGNNPMTDVDVTLNITGANTFNDVVNITNLEPGDNITVTFANFTASSTGTTNIEVLLPNDDSNIENTKTWEQNTTDYQYRYANNNSSNGGWGFSPETAEGIFLTKYHISGTALVNSVEAYINNSASATGNTVYGVVMNEAGTIIGQSDDYVIQEEDLGTWHSFTINNPPQIDEGNFLAGFAVTANGSSVYYAMGVQTENPNRTDICYHSAIQGGSLNQYNETFKNRFMIGATVYCVTPTAPTSVEATETEICSGESTTLSYEGGTGSTFAWYSGSCDGTPVAATVSPTETTTYYGRWQTSACGVSNCLEITITVSDLITAVAGDNDNTCEADYQLSGNDPTPGTGEWAVTDGTATINDDSFNNTSITITTSPVTLSWTLYNGACVNTDNVTITLDNATSITTQPQGVNATTGDNVSFEVIADGGNLTYQWKFESADIDGANQNTYQILSVTTDEAGNYNVVVTGTCGEATSENALLEVATSIEELAETGINIFPNPTTGIINISLPNNIEKSEVIITDVTGKLVYKETINQNSTIDLQSEAGIYLIRFNFDGKSVVSTIIVE